MASIVYQIDKNTGNKYAYESISYWDKEKKQPRSKRKYLGKVDPETGEIIPSQKDGSPLKISGTEAEEILRLRTILAENEKRIQTLEKDLREANTKISQQAMRLKEIAALTKY